MNVEIKLIQPHMMGKAAIYKFSEAVTAGGEVSWDGLDSRIRNAAWLAIAYLDGKPVGVGALKRPTANHIEQIEAYSGQSLNAYPLELGWIVVAPEARGHRLSKRIAQALLEKAKGGVFCTVRAENFAIQKACDGFDFTDTGARWMGVHGYLGLGLWNR